MGRIIAVAQQWIQDRIKKASANILCAIDGNLVDGHGHRHLIYHLEAMVSREELLPFGDAVRQYQLSYPLLLGFILGTLELGPRSGLAQDFVGVFM